jgi:two-component sensor histidine kinase
MTSPHSNTNMPSPELSFAMFETEVISRFGLMPNFFRSGFEAPGLIEELWKFAKAAYLDSPMPSLFKERLFVHLSRFCAARYCIIRHVGFLIGQGRPAGDAAATPHTVEEVVRLLQRPGLHEGDELDAILTRLESHAVPLNIPAPGSEEEHDIFAAATVIFLGRPQLARAREALRTALGGQRLEMITAYLAFIRTAHYWTVTHPELLIEKDMDALLRDHETLAELLLTNPEVAKGDIGDRLYTELVSLRLERDQRDLVREAEARREHAELHQNLLVDELNHRVKNILSIIQSLASQTLQRAGVPPSALRDFTDRLQSLALAYDLLTASNWAATDLEAVIHQSISVFGIANHPPRIHIKGPSVLLSARTSLSFSMAAHELATNAAKYGSLSNARGSVDIAWSVEPGARGERLKLQWRESGGPPVMPPTSKGFGTVLIERGLAAELNGTVSLLFAPPGVICTIEAPLPVLDSAA